MPAAASPSLIPPVAFATGPSIASATAAQAPDVNFRRCIDNPKMKPIRHVAAALATLAIGIGACLSFQTVAPHDSADHVASTLTDGQIRATINCMAQPS